MSSEVAKDKSQAKDINCTLIKKWRVYKQVTDVGRLSVMWKHCLKYNYEAQSCSTMATLGSAVSLLSNDRLHPDSTSCSRCVLGFVPTLVRKQTEY